jgi:phospholipid transport system substrate-binding protein
MGVKTVRQLAVILTIGLTALTAHAQAPVDVITGAMDELNEQLAGRKAELRADREALYDLIDGILLPRFDRTYAAQLVLGRHWRSASDAQRKRFIDALYQTLLRRYADGVLDFEEDRIEILAYRGSESDKRTSVRTMVELDDGTEVPVNYSLVKRDSGWLVFDVMIEGISYVRNFRAEMNSEIGAKGLDAVIERLESEASRKSAS